jgi:non-lysosomal glucosylceramidase
MWDVFAATGQVGPSVDPPPLAGAFPVRSSLRVGSVASSRRLPAGAEHTFEFLLAWHFPNRPRAWQGHILEDTNRDQRVRNHYATRFRDATDVVRQVDDDLPRLESRSRAFARAFHASSVPREIIEAAIQGITVLRSTTCFRIEDGTLLGWEGGFDQRGACEGSCTHVWNYAQTVAYLFPELERTMRRVEFLLETDDAGRMSFRTNRVFGAPRWDMLPAADGQLGTIVRLCREWLLSGDDEFLRQMWPAAQRAIAYALAAWDRDGDGLLEAERHNTYDIEFHGPDPLTNSMLLAALAAAARMADGLGDTASAEGYRRQLARSSAAMDARLWDGEYYRQELVDVDAHRYQFGSGCLADQLLGQCLAHLSGLGHLLPEDHVRSAIEAVYRHDFRPSLSEHVNLQRTFALGDEAGLVLCTWPKGGRPRLPFVYSDEVWTGVEYQVATELLCEGLVDEAISIVQAVRARHDGYRRSPWDEVEFGHHYARSMASWGVFVAFTGFRCDLSAGRISFHPAKDADDFQTFWSCGAGWGTYHQWLDPSTRERRSAIEVIEGSLEGVTVNG